MNSRHMFALVIILLATFTTVHSTSYYLDSRESGGSGSSSQPWSSLSSIDNYKFKAGDSVYFAKGSVFSGGFRLSSSGTSQSPITFTTYGTGSAPKFTNADYSALNGNVIQITGDYIVIDGLNFTNCVNSTSQNSQTILLIGAVYAKTGADFLIVKNCEFSDCPIGISVYGKNCLITNNYLHDCNRFLSDPDWGPIGVVIGNANAEVSYNRCDNYVKVGGNYGADGGFLELDSRFFGGPISNCKIHHNKTIGNQGFMEVTTAVDSNNVYYNVSEDYQEFIFWWAGNNSRMDNNTVIRTRPSNSGAANTVFVMANGNFSSKNNIFVVANGIQVWVTSLYGSGNYVNVIRSNNLYYCTDGSTADPCGLTKKSGETVSNPNFVDLKLGDYHLNQGSPCIDKGINLNYKLDIVNTPLPQNGTVDIGAYEYLSDPVVVAKRIDSDRFIQPISILAKSNSIIYIKIDRHVFSGYGFISISDLTGKQVYSCKIPVDGEFSWDIKNNKGLHVNRGLYIISISGSSNKPLSCKFPVM